MQCMHRSFTVGYTASDSLTAAIGDISAESSADDSCQ